MTVTGIERQKKDPDRYSIFIDGSFSLGVRSAVLLRSGLRKGDETSPEAIERLRSEDEMASAAATASRYAGRRRRTEQEIRTKLASLSFPPAVIDRTVDSLAVSGVIDDRAYVRACIHDAQLHHPAGGRMIAHRLRRKGISPEVLREEIEACLGPEVETELAARTAVRYLERLRRREISGRAYLPGEREARLRRYLTGRGFSRGAVESAMKIALIAHPPTT